MDCRIGGLSKLHSNNRDMDTLKMSFLGNGHEMDVNIPTLPMHNKYSLRSEITVGDFLLT
jgi:hypothetical protein